MISIVYEKENRRTAAYDDDLLIGECDYIEMGNVWNANHTFVNKNYAGRKIATLLLEKLVNNARADGKKINPICSFVKKKFDENSDYEDVYF